MAEEKIRVAAVSYLNTKPLLFGLRDASVADQLMLSMDYPAKIGQQLIADEVDLALIPVALIPQLPEHYIVSDYCIGADGPVASVCLFSDVPMEEIENVYLDYQSRSSVTLVRLLLRKYWKVRPVLLQASAGYEQKINGTTAGVVIGDRALQLRSRHRYIYDLAEAWINFAGLPFVFAAWVSNKKLPASFTGDFNKATGLGTTGEALEKVIAENPCDFFDLHDYYTKHISFTLDADKKKGLEKFLQYLRQPLERS